MFAWNCCLDNESTQSKEQTEANRFRSHSSFCNLFSSQTISIRSTSFVLFLSIFLFICLLGDTKITWSQWESKWSQVVQSTPYNPEGETHFSWRNKKFEKEKTKKCSSYMVQLLSMMYTPLRMLEIHTGRKMSREWIPSRQWLKSENEKETAKTFVMGKKFFILSPPQRTQRKEDVLILSRDEANSFQDVSFHLRAIHNDQV